MHLLSATLEHDRFPTRERYPFNLRIFQETGRIGFTAPVVCFVGENGSGKSTLLKAVARRCGIHLWGEIDRERYEHNPHENLLQGCLAVEWADGPVPGSFFDSQTFRNFTRLVDEWAASDPAMLEYYGGKSLVTQSHGQSLMAYFRNRYTRRGLYFMDEPETALSPKTQLELLELIGEMAAGGHAQFIIATHSPMLLSIPGAVIYSFDRGPVKRVEFRETEHFRLYRDFFQNLLKASRRDAERKKENHEGARRNINQKLS